MARVSTPKKMQEILKGKFSDGDPSLYLEYLSKYKATDLKGRYLHWDEFKHRVDSDDDKELAWAATRMARKGLAKVIELCPSANDTFEYCVPDALLSHLHHIDTIAGGSIGVSDNSLLQTKQSQEKYLVSSLLMEEAITSSQLEGAVTTRRVAKEMLTTERAPKDNSEKMILNNYRLMREAVRLKDEELSIELIKQFHLIATKDAIENNAIPGEFRTTDDISVRNQDEEIVHTPPKAELLEEYLQNFCNFANSSNSDSEVTFIHPVLKAIILHYLIGYIHPFGDGNGRAARALFYWLMLKSGYWLFEYVSISRLIKEAPVQYAVSYMKCESDENDVTYFLFDQIALIKKALDGLLSHLKQKQEEFYDFMRLLEDSKTAQRLSWRQKDILKNAARNPGKIYTAKEIQNKYDIASNTARSDLQKLADKDLLLTNKKGRTVQYLAPAGILDKLRTETELS